MPDITMKSEHTVRWARMLQSRARFSGPEASCHMRSSAVSITTTSESEFSVHTAITAVDVRQFGHAVNTDQVFGTHTQRDRANPHVPFDPTEGFRGCAMIKSAANPGRALPGNLACRG